MDDMFTEDGVLHATLEDTFTGGVTMAVLCVKVALNQLVHEGRIAPVTHEVVMSRFEALMMEGADQLEASHEALLKSEIAEAA